MYRSAAAETRERRLAWLVQAEFRDCGGSLPPCVRRLRRPHRGPHALAPAGPGDDSPEASCPCTPPLVRPRLIGVSHESGRPRATDPRRYGDHVAGRGDPPDVYVRDLHAPVQGRRKTRDGRAGGPVLAAAELAERLAGHRRASLECLVAVTVPGPVGDRPAAKLHAIALIPVALAAIASLVLLGMITASMRSCGLVNAGHTSERVLTRAMTCQPSPPVRAKARPIAAPSPDQRQSISAGCPYVSGVRR